MLLTATAQLSVDGVMQAPGVNVVEDERDFDRPGWAHFDDEAGAAMDEIFGCASAFLFGRRTYELFASTWGSWPDPGDSRIWTALNTQPKHVASGTLASHGWPGTSVLSGDVAAAVRALKATPGGELQVHGSGALFRWLLENDLVDEMNLFTFPVIVGRGTRLFAASGPGARLQLVSSRSTASGVLMAVYRRAAGLD
jgi:dihydrofolate reductase